MGDKCIEINFDKITIPVSEFDKVCLSENDILVIKTNSMLKQDEVADIEEVFSKKFGCKVVLLDYRYSIHGVMQKQ